MSYGIKDVTKREPCPLCGRDHWCAWMQTEYGRLLMCQTHNEKATFQGLDGLTYVYAGTSRSGTGMYEEESQYNRRIGDWKAQHAGAAKKSAPAQPRRMTILDEVVPLGNSTLDSIYRKFLSMLVLEEEHRAYLHSEGWSDELIEKNHIVSMPIDDFKRYKRKGEYFSQNKWRKTVAAELAGSFGTLKGVPGFYRKGGAWKLYGRSGIIFPLYDEEHRIYRLRIRMDFQDCIDKKQNGEYICESQNCFVEPLKGLYTVEKDGSRTYKKQGGKYRNFSSYIEDEEAYKQGFIKNRLEDGCQAANAAGCYYSEGDDMYCVYVTEGEKKGILGNSILHAPFISLPGVSSFSLLCRSGLLSKFKELGTKVFILAFDADKAANEAVMKAQNRAVELLKKEGLYVGTAEWDINLGKGIDDLLSAGYRPSFSVT